MNDYNMDDNILRRKEGNVGEKKRSCRRQMINISSTDRKQGRRMKNNGTTDRKKNNGLEAEKKNQNKEFSEEKDAAFGNRFAGTRKKKFKSQLKSGQMGR